MGVPSSDPFEIDIFLAAVTGLVAAQVPDCHIYERAQEITDMVYRRHRKHPDWVLTGSHGARLRPVDD